MVKPTVVESIDPRTGRPSAMVDATPTADEGEIRERFPDSIREGATILSERFAQRGVTWR